MRLVRMDFAGTGRVGQPGVRPSMADESGCGHARARRCGLHRPSGAVSRSCDLLGRTAVLAACWLFAVGDIAAQPQPIVERVDVARVIIDVRVIDDDGRPLRGLQPADFEVRIDGEPVRVESAFWVGDAAGNGDPPRAPVESAAISGFSSRRTAAN